MKPFTIFFYFVLNNFLYSQIPNGSFENWNNDLLIGWKQWCPGNIQNMWEYPITNPVDGNVAVKVEIKNVPINTQNGVVWKSVPGFLKLPDTGINNKPICLSGYFQFFPNVGYDTLFITTAFKKNGNLIGSSSFTVDTTVNSYQKFCSTITYISSDIPDTYSISVHLNANRPESQFYTCYFYLDKLEFSMITDLRSNHNDSEWTISSNPVDQVITITNEKPMRGITEAKFYSSSGALIQIEKLSQLPAKIDISENLSTYFILIIFEDEIPVFKRFLVKSN